MKKIFVFVFLTTFSAAYIQAQKVGTANNRSELPEQIWLENSEGKTITSSGASHIFLCKMGGGKKPETIQ